MAISHAINCDHHNCESFKLKFRSLSTGLSALHQDIRSIKAKCDWLDIFLSSPQKEFDAHLFTETWSTTHTDHQFLSNYSYNRLLRPHGRDGALAIYIKKFYPHSAIDEYSITSQNVECLSLSLPQTLVVVVYRPPKGNKQ